MHDIRSGGPIYAASYGTGQGGSNSMNISALSDDVSFIHFNNGHGGALAQHGYGSSQAGDNEQFTKTGRPRKIKEPKEARGTSKRAGADKGLGGSFMEDDEDGALGTQQDDMNGEYFGAEIKPSVHCTFAKYFFFYTNLCFLQIGGKKVAGQPRRRKKLVMDEVSPTLTSSKHRGGNVGYHSDGQQQYMSDMDIGLDPNEGLLGDYLDPMDGPLSSDPRSTSSRGRKKLLLRKELEMQGEDGHYAPVLPHQQRTNGFSNLNLSGFKGATPYDNYSEALFDDSNGRRKGAAAGKMVPPARKNARGVQGKTGLTPAVNSIHINGSDLSPSLLPLLSSPFAFGQTPNSKSSWLVSLYLCQCA